MGLHTTAVLIALALVCQNKLVEARACNGRSTVIQVRVPPKTNVTVKYPSQISPVKFVPSVTEADPQCFQCKNSKCQKCNNFNPTARTIPSQRPKSRTNIIIDLKGNHPKKVNASKNLYDTLVYIGDKNSASSVSNSTAKSTGGAAATTSAAASTSNTALIAAFNENENNGSSSLDNPPSNTENVYLEDTSQSSAISSASALADNLEPEKEPLSEPRVPDQDQPSKQQPQAEQVPTQGGQLPASGQQLTPEKQPASEQQPTIEQPPVSEQQQTKEPQLATGQQKTPEKQTATGEETKLDKEKEPESLNPTPTAENAKESEKSLVTDKSDDAKVDAALSSPTETSKLTENKTESIPDAKKVEENQPAVATPKQ